MLEPATTADLVPHIGRPLGTSPWHTVTQAVIDAFAAATGDHQWIHTDPDRARRELPGGTTIAHGYLTLSLIPALAATIYRVRLSPRAINYGSDKVRFTAPVPSGSRVRLHLTLVSMAPIPGGHRIVQSATMEIEGQDRPVLVAETLVLIYDPD